MTMGHYVDDPIRDARICASHDAWVTRLPDWWEEQEEEEEEQIRSEEDEKGDLTFYTE